MTACSRGNDELFNFLVTNPGLRQSLQCGQRKSFSNRQRKFCLGANASAKDRASTELSRYNFDYRHGASLAAICRKDSGKLPDCKGSAQVWNRRRRSAAGGLRATAKRKNCFL